MFSARSRLTSNPTKPQNRPVNPTTGQKPILSTRFFLGGE